MFEKGFIGKTGIEATKPLEEKDIVEIIHKVTSVLISTYPNSNLSYINIYKKLLDTPMFYAKIPNEISKVNYYYKNSSLYFDEKMDLTIIDEYVLHEFIHKLQEIKDNNGHIIRLGICEFNLLKVKGIGLNEGAIQYIITNTLKKPEKQVNICGVIIKSKSQYYSLLANLVSQLAFLLGEETLIDSTINGNEDFKLQIIDSLGYNNYCKIEKNMNTILENTAKKDNESIVKDAFFDTQNIIFKSYFNNILNRVETIDEINEVKNKLNAYKKIIGISPDYTTMNEYEKEYDDKTKNKAIEIQNKNALMVIRDNRLFNLFRNIKKLFINSTNEYNK